MSNHGTESCTLTRLHYKTIRPSCTQPRKEDPSIPFFPPSPFISQNSKLWKHPGVALGCMWGVGGIQSVPGRARWGFCGHERNSDCWRGLIYPQFITEASNSAKWGQCNIFHTKDLQNFRLGNELMGRLIGEGREVGEGRRGEKREERGEISSTGNPHCTQFRFLFFQCAWFARDQKKITWKIPKTICSFQMTFIIQYH